MAIGCIPYFTSYAISLYILFFSNSTSLVRKIEQYVGSRRLTLSHHNITSLLSMFPENICKASRCGSTFSIGRSDSPDNNCDRAYWCISPQGFYTKIWPTLWHLTATPPYHGAFHLKIKFSDPHGVRWTYMEIWYT